MVFLEYSMCLLLALANLGNLLNSCALILYKNKVFKRGSTRYSNGENLANLKRPGYCTIDFHIRLSTQIISMNSCHVMLLIKGKCAVSDWEEELFDSLAGVASRPIPLCGATTFMWEANKRPGPMGPSLRELDTILTCIHSSRMEDDGGRSRMS